MSLETRVKMLPPDLVEVIYDWYLDLVEYEKTRHQKKIVNQDIVRVSMCAGDHCRLWCWCPVCGEQYIEETGICECFWSLNMIT